MNNARPQAIPGTVSKILWHFTGGPLWDEQLQHQATEVKSDDNAFEILKKILHSKYLKASQYSEIIRGHDRDAFNLRWRVKQMYEAMMPKYLGLDAGIDMGSDYLMPLRLVDEQPIVKTIKTMSVVCVADIPLQHLSYHAHRYGRFAIGFHRHALVKSGFNPVFYSPQKSDLMEMIVEIWSDVEKEAEKEQKNGGLRAMFGNNVQLAIKLRKLVAFMKTFDVDQFDSIYCEREWRKLGRFDFDWQDVAMIVAPKENGFFSSLIGEFPHVPRSIPMVPWEDLIEH